VADLQHCPIFFMPFLTHQLRRVTSSEGQVVDSASEPLYLEGA
jgi:hypothetical protein